MSTTTNGNMKSFKVTDKDGNVFILTPVDTQARQAIDEAKNLQFDEDYFTADVSQDQSTVNVGLNGVPLGVDTDTPLKFAQDTAQGIVLGSDAPFATAVAPEYDPTATYPTVGTAVMYKGLCYVNNVAINSDEEWNPDHWDETNLTSEIDKKAFTPEMFTGASKNYSFSFLSKYASHLGYNDQHIIYNELTGLCYISGTIEVLSAFTPSYSSSDPGSGSATWPVVAEFDVSNIVRSFSAKLIFGDMVPSTPWMCEFFLDLDKNQSKGYVKMSSNKQIPGNKWLQIYSATIL